MTFVAIGTFKVKNTLSIRLNENVLWFTVFQTDDIDCTGLDCYDHTIGSCSNVTVGFNTSCDSDVGLVRVFQS